MDEYESTAYILSGDRVRDRNEILNVNGYTIYKPYFFKNLAYARAFEIALVLARTKPSWSGVIILSTTECIDIIMEPSIPEIQLDPFVKNPRVPAHDAMKLVPTFFKPGYVTFGQHKNGRRMWYVELKKNHIQTP